MTAVSFFLYFFAALAIVGALGMLLQKNPITASLSLAVTFLSLAGMYAALDAHFLAVIQVIVYAGLIQVLIIYTIMLMDLGPDEMQRRVNVGRLIGGAAAVLLTVQLAIAGGRALFFEAAVLPAGYGTTAAVAEILFSRYLLPFEIVAVLLLAGMSGAVVLAKQETARRPKTELPTMPTPIDTESSVNPKLIKR